jgi:hypothetical protein
MRTLFTVETTGFENTTERYEALEELSNALRREFPAYYVAERTQTDFVAAVVVSSMTPDALVPCHLNGWGHGRLTMKLVA